MGTTHWAMGAALMGGIVLIITTIMGKVFYEPADEPVSLGGRIGMGCALGIFAGVFWLWQLALTITESGHSPQTKIWLWLWLFAVLWPLLPEMLRPLSLLRRLRRRLRTKEKTH